jgi:NTP pyrophosphatase (non-canonical NTP hydrolase)
LFSHESDILRKLRLLESLKAELVTNVGQLYQAIARNGGQSITEGLASVILSCYILARRLGIDFAALDETVSAKISQNIKREHEAEELFGDFSEYQRYLRKRGG